jgi:ferredoxin
VSSLTRRGFLALLSGPLASGAWTEAASLHTQPGPDGAPAGPPAGAPARLESRRLALHRDSCLAWGGTDCVACYIACPLRGRALVFERERPRLDLDVCTGCGDCVPVCHTVNDRRALRWENAPPADRALAPAAA